MGLDDMANGAGPADADETALAPARGGPANADETALAPVVGDTADADETALAPVAGLTPDMAPDATRAMPSAETGMTPALAWSEAADDDYDITPVSADEYPGGEYRDGEYSGGDGGYPQLADDIGAASGWHTFDHETAPAALAWYQRPVVLIIGTALVVLALVAAIMIALHIPAGAPVTPTPSVTSTPGLGTPPPSSTPATESSPPPAPQPTETTQAPYNPPPAWTQPQTTQPPAQAPATQQPASTVPPTTQEPPTPIRRFPRLFPPRGYPLPGG